MMFYLDSRRIALGGLDVSLTVLSYDLVAKKRTEGCNENRADLSWSIVLCLGRGRLCTVQGACASPDARDPARILFGYDTYTYV